MGLSETGENQLLWWYFQNYLEYPPLNYIKASRYVSKLVMPGDRRAFSERGDIKNSF
jgi:hypothetical protein